MKKVKRLLVLLIGLLVMIPTIASAHTELTSSNPAANQVVKEDLKEIVLTYEGKIEALSTMTLIKDGQEGSLVSVTSKENQLIGTLSAPLSNGSYNIEWSIAGKDGHPITGEIPFTVQKEVKEEPKADTKQPVTPKKEVPKKNDVKQDKTDNASKAASNLSTIIVVAVTVVLIIGLFLLFRRKR